MSMNTELQLVTPEMAMRWLQNNPRNRHCRPDKVRRLVRSMREGTFRTTHQGIAMLADGTIADGQHRLSAIVQSGVSVTLLVTSGLSLEAAEAIDYDIAPRKMHDVFRMANEHKMLSRGHVVAVVRALLQQIGTSYGRATRAPSLTDVQNYYRQHQVCIDSVIDNLPKRHDTWSNSLAVAVYVAALAADAIDIHQMQRFHAILVTGEYDRHSPGERMAILFRNMLMNHKGAGWRFPNTGTSVRKMQNALQYFAAGQEVAMLREPKELLWPAPPYAMELHDD